MSEGTKPTIAEIEKAMDENPGGIEKLRQTLGDHGQVFSPTPDELPGLAQTLAASPPDIMAIHGAAEHLAPLVPSLVDAVYDKLFSYDATALCTIWPTEPDSGGRY